MEFGKLERELRGQGDLRALAETPESRALASRIDAKTLRDAAERGDTAALQSVLRQVLSTPEGRALAQQVQKAVGNK